MSTMYWVHEGGVHTGYETGPDGRIYNMQRCRVRERNERLVCWAEWPFTGECETDFPLQRLQEAITWTQTEYYRRNPPPAPRKEQQQAVDPDSITAEAAAELIAAAGDRWLVAPTLARAQRGQKRMLAGSRPARRYFLGGRKSGPFYLVTRDAITPFVGDLADAFPNEYTRRNP